MFPCRSHEAVWNACNTLRDNVSICELKIEDEEKYERVVGCEREKSGKVSVKQIEMCCRETLGDMSVICR